MSLTELPSLTAEALDDLIYYARTGDLEALKSTITDLSTSQSVTAEQIIEAAIESEADESESGSGCCLLHWPAANGKEDVLSYLLSLLSTEERPTQQRAMSNLINHQNASGNTPLHWAAVNGHLSCVKTLVAAGADPAITNHAGHDALYEADCSGKEGGREVAEWMLANCTGLEKGLGQEGMGEEPVAEDGVDNDGDEMMGGETNGT